jgi:hypothetical protein
MACYPRVAEEGSNANFYRAASIERSTASLGQQSTFSPTCF